MTAPYKFVSSMVVKTITIFIENKSTRSELFYSSNLDITTL